MYMNYADWRNLSPVEKNRIWREECRALAMEREIKKAREEERKRKAERYNRLDSFYGACYGATMNEIRDAYNESRACEVWD